MYVSISLVNSRQIMPSLPYSSLWRDAFSKYYNDIDQLQSNDTPTANQNRSNCFKFCNGKWVCVDGIFIITIITPILLSSWVLLVPLSINDGRTINPWLFTLFQCIYTMIGYPLMLFCFDFAIPGLKGMIKYVIIIVIGQIMIVPFFVLYNVYGLNSLSFARTFGTFFYGFLISMVYFLYSTVLSIRYRKRKSFDLKTNENNTAHESKNNDNLQVSIQNAPLITLNEPLLETNTDTSNENKHAETVLHSNNNRDMSIWLAYNLVKKVANINENIPESIKRTYKNSYHQFYYQRKNDFCSNKFLKFLFPILHLDDKPLPSEYMQIINDSSDEILVAKGSYSSLMTISTANAGVDSKIYEKRVELPSSWKFKIFIYYHWKQFFYGSLLITGAFCDYLFCQWLTATWQSFAMESQSDGIIAPTESLDSLMLFLSFWIATHSFRFVFKRFGRLADRNKSNGISTEICMEWMTTAFYYVFYRNLFLHVSSIFNFLMIKAAHMCLEIITYPLRMSSYAYVTLSNLYIYLCVTLKVS